MKVQKMITIDQELQEKCRGVPNISNIINDFLWDYFKEPIDPEEDILNKEKNIEDNLKKLEEEKKILQDKKKHEEDLKREEEERAERKEQERFLSNKKALLEFFEVDEAEADGYVRAFMKARDESKDTGFYEYMENVCGLKEKESHQHIT